MDDTVITESDLLFKVNQIICLEYQYTCLYGEVIQLVHQRGLCWFRPICITLSDLNSNQNVDSPRLINLQSCSDLLWPIILFRPALDTEVISFLPKLNNDSDEFLFHKKYSRQYLNKFIQQVWQANKDKF